MTPEGLVYALTDYPQEIEDLMKALQIAPEDNSFKRRYIAYKDKVKIVNFGENIDSLLLSPKYLGKGI